MSEPYLVRLKPEIIGQSLRGLLYVLLLLATGFSLLSCAAKPSSSNSVAGGNAPAASPVAQTSPSQAEPPKKNFESGEAVPAGYFGYKVFASWFSDRVSQKDGKQSGPANYLYIDLAIVNTDRKERAVAPMKLIDEAGKEYALSDKSPTNGESVQSIGKVSPNVSKRARAIFEVPQGHAYKLKIQGFSTTDEVQIALKPGAAPPSR